MNPYYTLKDQEPKICEIVKKRDTTLHEDKIIFGWYFRFVLSLFIS